MSTLLQDVRYGLRMLVKSPVVAGVAALSLAAAIAVNAAAFAVVNAFLFEPLPYPEQDRIALMLQRKAADETAQQGTTAAEFLEMREAVTAFESVTGYRVVPGNVTDDTEAEQLQVLTATAGFMDVVGVQPVLGRGFRSEDAAPGAPPVVVLDHAYWNRRYLGGADVLGQVLTLDGLRHTVVGVMPEDFDPIPAGVALYRPDDFAAEWDEPDASLGLVVMGRMKQGATLVQVEREMGAVHRAFEERHPGVVRGWTPDVQLVRDFFPGDTDRRLVLILAAVTLCGLVIACANVANLLLARAEARQKEMAVRTALGAARHRILRQLLTESVLLALIGGVAGTACAFWVVGILAAGMPAELPRAFMPELAPAVLVVLLVVSMGAGVLFGLAPALHAVGGDLRGALGEGSRGGTAGRARKRLRDAFVVGEFAVALVLLSGAALLGRAFTAMITLDPGFDTAGVLTFDLSVPVEKYPDDRAVRLFYGQAFEALEALPGVDGVAAMTTLPRATSWVTRAFDIDARPTVGDEVRPESGVQAVNADYFAALGVDLVHGRGLEESDRSDSSPVVVVNDAFSQRYFPAGSALGQRITVEGASREIVGIAETIVQDRIIDPARGPTPYIYLPYEQWTQRSTAVAVRATGDLASLTGAVRDAIGSVDADVPLGNVQSLDAFIAASLAGPRLLSMFLALVGGVALTLAAMGIYGVLAHSVEQRQREIGIRMAMGARGGQVVRMVTRSGLTLVAVGMAIGVPLSALGFLVISRALAGVGEVANPVSSFLLVAGALSMVALLASWMPAARAARVQPVRALEGD
ncbi:MAG TPA: ABC transporter permease [Longimicrobiales bacterium]